MTSHNYKVESRKPFAESLIWQLNRDFYQELGIKAWSEGIVPHQLTSNSKVGKTYAELIFGFLKDLALKEGNSGTVYILELGAGHGRLAFHIIKHLEKLVDSINTDVPDYCFVLSDIVEDNLSFFQHHPQLQKYLQNGTLDVAYFDGVESEELHLRHAQITIQRKELQQPIIAIANYFFDSLPNDLYFIKDKEISSCAVSIESIIDPESASATDLLTNMEMTYYNEPFSEPQYKEPILNEILNNYRDLLSDSYLFFPEKSIQCLLNLKELSNAGLVLLTMDKGYHELKNLSNRKKPDIITHGSFSLWVNFHALDTYCKKQGGTTFFPSFSNFHLEIGCLMFLPEGETYLNTHAAYQEFVNNFGPDDFNSIKQLAYFNVSRITLQELIAFLRLSSYDSTIFINFLPRLKQLYQSITHSEHERLVQTLHQVWDIYFHINEPIDIAYEIGGILYDLGHYTEALDFFQYSVQFFDYKADIYYNQALCYYQLRQDKLFLQTINEGQKSFPDYEPLGKLKDLEMG
ncbi:SAM-dependent methyltransferase [Portibacter lacus]|uniref:Tetratricopeptide repeat protein n=1 Tax=Portibacter lacus TaxID=1099794 RepID=A0AA37WDE3_9BACT|nr:SAM-dependent methyltransferase [Portibacter lacus]GLR16828.1 hypothetical protein GCM10007940_14430 [Portibacter lacus]